MRDRLLLTPERITGMAEGVRDVAKLADPVRECIAEWRRPNGLLIRKVRVPLGVVGIIYESRPNVTVDTVALTLENWKCSRAAGRQRIRAKQSTVAGNSQRCARVPDGAIELLDSSTRDSVHELIKARGLVDVIIPRGGAQLISFVVENSTVPVIELGQGTVTYLLMLQPTSIWRTRS